MKLRALVFATSVALCFSAWSQQRRPDSGVLQERPGQIPAPPSQKEPSISLPKAKPTQKVAPSPRIIPAAFVFQGNTVFDSQVLQALVASFVNRSTDLAGINAAATAVRDFYRAQGYVLTEVYIPEQTLRAEGGTITIAVIEARVGRVRLRVDGEGISESFAQSMLDAHLKTDDLINEYSLEKPVLLLRDLTGFDASASVEPGAQTGQADIIVTVKAQGDKVEGAVGLDNGGAYVAGINRVLASLSVNNVSGRGDVLSLRANQADMPGSNMIRASYAVPVGGLGSRVSFSVGRIKYALGKQFSNLGASGSADIVDLGLTHPFVRSRQNNFYGLLALQEKTMRDLVSTQLSDSKREITSVRAGVFGHFLDGLFGANSFNAYGLSWVSGRVKLDAASLASDQLAGGFATAGAFSKVNWEFQRTHYLNRGANIHVGLQGQAASKNLASAEKLALGGPSGVRAYGVGEGVGDTGAMLNLEYRHLLGATPVPVSVVAFYDRGWIRFNKNGAVPAGSSNKQVLGGVGVGVVAGRTDRSHMKLNLAWRTTAALPSTGELDRKPRVWVIGQIAF